MPDDKPKLGRPPKPTTPESLHMREMEEWAKLGIRIRKVIEGQIATFEEQLKDANEGRSTLTLDARLNIVSGLKDLLIASMKITESGMKLLAQPAKPEHQDNIEDVIRELQGGKG